MQVTHGQHSKHTPAHGVALRTAQHISAQHVA